MAGRRAAGASSGEHVGPDGRACCTRVTALSADAVLEAAHASARTLAKVEKPLSPASIHQAAHDLSHLYLNLDRRREVEHDGISLLSGDVNDHLQRLTDGQAEKKARSFSGFEAA